MQFKTIITFCDEFRNMKHFNIQIKINEHYCSKIFSPVTMRQANKLCLSDNQ